MFVTLRVVLDQQAATVEALRARIAAMGGGLRAGQARPRPRQNTRPGQRAEELGFAAEAGVAGEIFVRRLSVDLLPHLERSGLSDMPATADLRDLLGYGCDPAGPAWVSDEGVGALDIECLGLHGSGVIAFLVGLGVQRGCRLEVEQHLLVDPDGEAAMLAAVAARIAAHRLWLTYNGRTFDIPVLAARCTLNRLDPASMQPRLHGDLLTPVRRLFRDRLGACTLRHAEMSLLNLHRVDDVPGAEAPARYRAWLRGAPGAVVAGVVAHNLQDVVSTVVVGARLATHVAGQRVEPRHPADGYHLARHLERCGGFPDAEVELRDAVSAGAEPWARRAAHRLAVLLQRRGALAEATAVWHRLYAEDPDDLVAARGYAIRLERSGRCAEALAVCEQVDRRRAQLGRWWGRTVGGGTRADDEWSRRAARLRRRVRS